MYPRTHGSTIPTTVRFSQTQSKRSKNGPQECKKGNKTEQSKAQPPKITLSNTKTDKIRKRFKNSTEKHQNTQSTTPCTCQKCQGFYMSEEYLIGGLGTTKGANGNPNASPRRPQEPSLVTPRAKPSTPHRPPPSPPTPHPHPPRPTHLSF